MVVFIVFLTMESYNLKTIIMIYLKYSNLNDETKDIINQYISN